MNSKQDDVPRLDPGESTLPRKRLLNLQMEATVFQEATNLQPPLDPPQPPLDPAQPPADIPILNQLNKYAIKQKAKKEAFVDLAPRTNAPKDQVPETQLC